MCVTWEALRSSLKKSLSTLKAIQQFQQFAGSHEALGRFSSPEGLVATLRDSVVSPAAKNDLLRLLVALAQRGAPLAQDLLVLALSPALERACGCTARRFAVPADEALSEFIDAFLACVQDLDLEAVNRVAATLVLNAQRRLTEHHALRQKRAALDDPLDAASDTAMGTVEPPTGSALGLRPGATEDEDVAALREWLRPIVGADAELIVGAVVSEENQRLLAQRLGISHRNARVRLHRALKRLREQLKGRL